MNAKPIAIILILAAILNLILFVFGRISQLVFWSVVTAIAIIAYKVLPKIKNKGLKKA